MKNATFDAKLVDDFFNLLIERYSSTGGELEKRKLARYLVDYPGIQYSTHRGSVLHNVLSLSGENFDAAYQAKLYELNLSPELINMQVSLGETILHETIYLAGFFFQNIYTICRTIAPEVLIKNPLFESIFAKTEFLLELKANPNIAAYGGSTPLHIWATSQNEPRYAELLVKYQADVNCQDDSGQTPLHHACICNEWMTGLMPQNIKTLLNLGANPLIFDNLKEKPIDKLSQYIRKDCSEEAQNAIAEARKILQA